LAGELPCADNWRNIAITLIDPVAWHRHPSGAYFSHPSVCPVLQFQQLFRIRRRIDLLADRHTPLCWFGINSKFLGGRFAAAG
jgi:hypothetical protein